MIKPIPGSLLRMNRFREFFARNLALFDLNLMSDVTYTGKPYPISGDGTETWKLKDIPLE